MPFLTSRLTAVRFSARRQQPIFDAGDVALLVNHAIGSQRIAAGDGGQHGWVAGDHALDTDFTLEKNIVNDSLQFGLRIDTNKPPAELLKAYTAIELKAMATENPSGIPSKRQRREAKQLAKDKLEEESRDGRFIKRRVYPVMWDATAGELLVGATSAKAIETALHLFAQTFGFLPQPLFAGSQAAHLAEARGLTRAVDDASPSVFTAGQGDDIAWELTEQSRNFLGNEFLLWLWYYLENKTDTLKLTDDSEAVVMLARSLYLECPRGQTGKESIRSDGPTRLAECLRAIQTGKLPRKVGLTVVRHDAQYELTLQAETLAIGGAKLPAVEGDGERARLENRVTQIRHLLETLDLLYDAFLQRRLGAGWAGELAAMKRWLSLDQRKGAVA